jgi:hypothetical protein
MRRLVFATVLAMMHLALWPSEALAQRQGEYCTYDNEADDFTGKRLNTPVYRLNDFLIKRSSGHGEAPFEFVRDLQLRDFYKCKGGGFSPARHDKAKRIATGIVSLDIRGEVLAKNFCEKRPEIIIVAEHQPRFVVRDDQTPAEKWLVESLAADTTWYLTEYPSAAQTALVKATALMMRQCGSVPDAIRVTGAFNQYERTTEKGYLRVDRYIGMQTYYSGTLRPLEVGFVLVPDDAEKARRYREIDTAKWARKEAGRQLRDENANKSAGMFFLMLYAWSQWENPCGGRPIDLRTGLPFGACN